MVILEASFGMFLEILIWRAGRLAEAVVDVGKTYAGLVGKFAGIEEAIREGASNVPHPLEWLPGAIATLIFAAIALFSLLAARTANKKAQTAIDVAVEQAKKQETIRLRDKILEQMKEVLETTIQYKRKKKELLEKINNGLHKFNATQELVDSIEVTMDKIAINPFFTSKLRLLSSYYNVWYRNLKNAITVMDKTVTLIHDGNYLVRDYSSYDIQDLVVWSIMAFYDYLHYDFSAIMDYSIDEFEQRLCYEKEYYTSIRIRDFDELHILVEAMDNLVLLKPFGSMKNNYSTPDCRRKHLFQPEKHTN